MKKGIPLLLLLSIITICIYLFQQQKNKEFIENSNLFIQKDVRYTDPVDVPRTFDLYRAKGSHGPSPTLIFVHGGAWTHGSKLLNKRWNIIFNEIVKDGYTAISIDYTLYSKKGYSYEYPVIDVRTAINYVKKNAKSLGVDPTNIGLAGASAGGHLALLTGLQPDIQKKIQYIVAWYPITDLTTMHNSTSLRSTEIVEKYMNSSVEQMTKEYMRMSPIQYVKETKIPIFIVHGTGDTLVPYSQSVKFAKKNPKKVSLILLDKGNHGFTNLSIKDSTKDTINFLKARLNK